MLPRTVHAPSSRTRRKRVVRRAASFAVFGGAALFALTAVSLDADAVDLPDGEQVTISASVDGQEASPGTATMK